MRKHFRYLFSHNHWANERVLICMEKENVVTDQTLSLYSHIISAEMIWNLRIKGLPTSPFPIWQKYKLEELKTMTEDSNKNWMKLIEEHPYDTFQEMIFYEDSQGKKHENTVAQIMNQVLTHSAYHRGQINIKIREAGVDPPQVDYIHFKRLT